jgi:hypothetical protein
MNSPTDLITKLTQQPDINTAIAVYKEAQEIIKTYEEVKTEVKDFVVEYMAQTGESKGRTTTGAYGITNPTPQFRVNEDRWQSACKLDLRLAAIQKQFDAAQRALDAAQRDFLEEATPEPFIYIR